MRQLYYCPKKERRWKQRKLDHAEKWVRGGDCTMTRSLHVNSADQLIWETVVRVLAESSILKDEVEVATGFDLKKPAAIRNAPRKRELAELKKEESRLAEAFSRLEADRLLDRLDADQYSLVRKHIETERIALAAKLEVLEDELDGCQKRKLWLDWIRRFQKRVATSDLSTEQRREFLTGVLESIDVYLDDPKTHRLRLNFKMEIINEDSLPTSSKGLVKPTDTGGSSVDVPIVRMPPTKKNCGGV